MSQDPQTAAVEAELLMTAAMLAAGTGTFAITNDPTLQATDVANAMHMKWEMCRSYYAALVGAMGDTKDWTPPTLSEAATQGAAKAVQAASQAAVPSTVTTAILAAAQAAIASTPGLTLPAAIAAVLKAASTASTAATTATTATSALPVS